MPHYIEIDPAGRVLRKHRSYPDLPPPPETFIKVEDLAAVSERESVYDAASKVFRGMTAEEVSAREAEETAAKDAQLASALSTFDDAFAADQAGQLPKTEAEIDKLEAADNVKEFLKQTVRFLAKHLTVWLLLLSSWFSRAAVTFDGVDDHVSNIGAVSTYSFFQNAQVFTISAWLKLGSTTARSGIAGNLSSTASKGFFFLYENAGGAYGTSALRIQINKGTLGIPVIEAKSPDNAITDTAWHHVAVVGAGTGNAITFYVDGVALSTTYITSFVSFSTGDSSAVMFAGALNNSGTAILPFNGAMQDLRIYNRTLSAAEILSDFNAKAVLPLSFTGLVGWWPMDNGATGTSADGDTVFDHAGGNHGTGNDGATNGTLLWSEGSLSYPPAEGAVFPVGLLLAAGAWCREKLLRAGSIGAMLCAAALSVQAQTHNPPLKIAWEGVPEAHAYRISISQSNAPNVFRAATNYPAVSFIRTNLHVATANLTQEFILPALTNGQWYVTTQTLILTNSLLYYTNASSQISTNYIYAGESGPSNEMGIRLIPPPASTNLHSIFLQSSTNAALWPNAAGSEMFVNLTGEPNLFLRIQTQP